MYAVFRVLIGVLLAGILSGVCCAESAMTPTGFYYPVGTDALRVSGCGQWLERPNGVGNDCYPESDKYHTGVDMMFGYNVEVRAVADGVVVDHIGVTSQAFGANNLALVIEHRSAERGTFRAVYGHIQIAGAKAMGTAVQAGETVGKIGHWYDGDHLHFGVISPGLPGPINTGSYGRWGYDKYGVIYDNDHPYYDNGFIDPIDFIVHNGPDNSVTRQTEAVPNSITTSSSWFLPLCWQASNPDSRCNMDAYMSYLECSVEKSSLCADAPSAWSALASSGRGSGPGGGDSGGPYNLNQDTDILDPATGQELIAGTATLKPSQTVNIRVKLISEGGDVRNYMDPGKDTIETDIYVRLGSGKWNFYKRMHTKAYNLGSGTKNETISYVVPGGISEISFRAYVDAEDEVNESTEGDNWSRIETFRMDSSAWMIPITNYLLED